MSTGFKAIVFLSALALTVFFTFSHWQVDTLTVRLPKEGDKLVAAAMVSQGDPVVLSYRHSVEKGQVEGRFVVGPDNSLKLVETRMDSVGTGLPNESPDRSHREGDFLVVDEPGQDLAGFRFFLEPINQTRLRVDGQELSLAEVKTGGLLEIGLEQVSLGRYLAFRQGVMPWPKPGGRK